MGISENNHEAKMTSEFLETPSMDQECPNCPDRWPECPEWPDRRKIREPPMSVEEDVHEYIWFKEEGWKDRGDRRISEMDLQQERSVHGRIKSCLTRSVPRTSYFLIRYPQPKITPFIF